MGGAKNTQVCICKTLKFCSHTCVFVRNNPFIVGVFLFVFLIFKYFPSVFSILIYSSPVLACTIVLIKFLSCLQHSKEQNESASVKDDSAKRNESPSLHTQTSKRRNANEKSREWDNDNSISRSVPRGEKLNENLEGKGGSSLDGGDSSSLSGYVAEKVQRLDEKPDSEVGNGFDDRLHKSIDGGGSELEVESTEEAEDEDEDGHEYGHKALEWTEDDQKNLMDLGSSEIERNKRLESLIAKRRARKLMKMQVEKDLIDLNNKEQVGQIAPILIARNNLLHIPDNSYLAEDSPLPGSAPSVLVPGRNPFDLPYDPQEERPNLLGDSFQQEFTIAHQKEMFFCRHESFTFGSFQFGDSKQEPRGFKRYPDFMVTKPRPLEGSGFSKFKWSPYKEDREKPFRRDESSSQIDGDKGGGQLPEPDVDSEGPFHEKEREAELSMIRTEGKEEANASDMESEPSDRNDESSSSSLSEAKEHNYQANETSPRSDPFPNYGDMSKEVTASSGETWVASSHLSAVEELEAMSTEVNEISEEDIIQVGFSGVNQDSDDSMVLALHPGQGAPSATEKSASYTGGIYNVSDPTLHASDGMEDLKSIESIDAEPLAEETNPTSIKSIEDEPEKLAVEGNDESTTMEDLVQEPETLTIQGNTEEAEAIEDKDYLKLNRDSEGDQGNVEAGSFGGDQGNVDAGSFGGDIRNVEAGSFGGDLGNVEARSFGGDLGNVEDGYFGGDQGNVEGRSFRSDQSSDAFTSSAVESERVFNQDSGDLVGSTVQPELAVEQISNHSSLSSSPKSVLPDKVPVDEVSSWSFNPEVHVTVQQTNMEDDSLHEFLPPNFNVTMPPNAQHLMEDSAAQSFNNSDYEGQQEPSNTSERTSEASISHNIIESAVHDKEGEEKKSVEDNEGESQSTKSASQDAVAESSKPDELTISRSIEDGLERTSAYGASIGPSYYSYPTEENANSDIPSSMENEQEPSDLPMKSTEEANIVHNLNVLEVSGNAYIASKEEDKDLVGMPKADKTSSSRSIMDIEVESNKVTEDEVIAGASKAMGENGESISTPDADDIQISMEHGISPTKPEDTKDNSEFARDVEGDSKNLMGYETTIYPPEQGNLNCNSNIPIFVPGGEELSDPPPEKSTEEANIILTENEAEAGQMNIKQTSESVGDSEGDSQSSISQFAVVGPSEATEVTNSVTIQDSEGKSGQLMHDKYAKDTPEPVEDNTTLDTIGDVKENKGETADLSQDDTGTNK